MGGRARRGGQGKLAEYPHDQTGPLFRSSSQSNYSGIIARLPPFVADLHYVNPAAPFRLPMQRLTFDEHGDPQRYQHVIVQIQKQRLVVVYPPERATGQVDFSLAAR